VTWGGGRCAVGFLVKVLSLFRFHRDVAEKVFEERADVLVSRARGAP
jgi:hypothetical protein